MRRASRTTAASPSRSCRCRRSSCSPSATGSSPRGLLAAAITVALEGFGELPDDLLPHPDVGSAAGWRFASQPVAVRALPAATRIERVRRAFSPDGGVTEEDDAIELARLTVDQLEAEGRAAGFAPEPARHIEPTADHVGAEVVLLRA
jgi:hypothetical protein